MKSYQEYKTYLHTEIRRSKDICIALNDDLADNPEISGQEYRSSQKMVELLQGHGFRVEYPFAGFDTAFLGVVGEQKHTHKIAILAEYDALPELGHACGHCLSGSISVLAALALVKLQDELDADIHIIGTPSEEIRGVKSEMASQGIFDGYDLAMMVHLYDDNVVATKLLAVDTFLYTFYGKASHAANAPWCGDNALNGVQLFFHAMDMLRQHVKPDVRLHGMIRNGGQAPNVVPEKASAEIYVRALDREYQQEVVRKVEDCARGAAIATQTTWEWEYTSNHYDNLLENKCGMEALQEVFEELGLQLSEEPDTIFGSSDIGNVSFRCPTFHPGLQVVNKGTKIHTRDFAAAMKTEAAHKALVQGAELIAYMVAKVLTQPGRLAEIKAEFCDHKKHS